MLARSCARISEAVITAGRASAFTRAEPVDGLGAGGIGQVDAQPAVLREDRRALDDVLQFADVAGPVVARKPARIAFRQSQLGFQRLALAVEKVLRQQRNVLAPLAQRHRLHRKHVEAEIEVFAKPAALHFLLEVAVGGGDQADVDGAGALCADAFEIALLQHPQQLALQFERNFADLVEKQRAAVGEFEPADAVAHRAGEGAADMAEELALEQFARDRRAIDPDQRPVAAAARLVDGARDQFLAGAGFACDHDGRRGRRHQLDLAQRLLDRLALADDAARIGLDADFFLQIGVFQLQPLAQAVDFGERRMQFFVGVAALADVAEHDDRADHDAAVADRRRGVFDPDRRAVLAPEHLAFDLVHGAVAKRRVDRAVMIGIVPAVMMGVMNDRVDFLADQFVRAPSPACARRPD